MATIDFDFDSDKGKQVLKNLYAFSFDLFKKMYRKEVNERGKSFRDYVHEAIERHLRGKDPHDPTRSPLEYHLKFHVIRRLLYNDLSPAAKREYLRAKNSDAEVEEMLQRISMPTLPGEPSVPEPSILGLSDYDRELLFKEIEKQIDGDDVVERIYLAVAHEKFNLSDREEICQECRMSHKDFDNGRRRFLTILKRVFNQLQLI